MLLGRKLGGGRNIPKKSGMALITYEKDHENSGSSNSPEPNSTSWYISGSSQLVYLHFCHHHSMHGPSRKRRYGWTPLELFGGFQQYLTHSRISDCTLVGWNR